MWLAATKVSKEEIERHGHLYSGGFTCSYLPWMARSVMMIIAAKQFNMTSCPLTSMVPKLCRNIHVQLELNLPAVHSGPFVLFWLVVTTTVLDPLPNHTKQKSWLNNSLADRQTDTSQTYAKSEYKQQYSTLRRRNWAADLV